MNTGTKLAIAGALGIGEGLMGAVTPKGAAQYNKYMAKRPVIRRALSTGQAVVGLGLLRDRKATMPGRVLGGLMATSAAMGAIAPDRRWNQAAKWWKHRPGLGRAAGIVGAATTVGLLGAAVWMRNR